MLQLYPYIPTQRLFQNGKKASGDLMKLCYHLAIWRHFTVLFFQAKNSTTPDWLKENGWKSEAIFLEFIEDKVHQLHHETFFTHNILLLWCKLTRRVLSNTEHWLGSRIFSSLSLQARAVGDVVYENKVNYML